MAKLISTSANTTIENNIGEENIMKNIINAIIHFFVNLFGKKEPTRKELLDQELNALCKENELLEEIQKALKAYPGWNDPYIYKNVCDLVKKLECTPDRYRGSEQLHNYAEGNFYYNDEEHQWHEVPYSQMCDEYRRLDALGAIPKDWESYQPKGRATYDYLFAMKLVISRLKTIKFHVDLRQQKNQERIDAILDEMYPTTIVA